MNKKFKDLLEKTRTPGFIGSQFWTIIWYIVLFMVARELLVFLWNIARSCFGF